VTAATPALALRLAEEVPPREHARRVCLGAFRGSQPPEQALLIQVGERASTVVLAARRQPVAFWTIGHGLLARVLAHSEPGRSGPEHARLLRAAARETIRPERLGVLRGLGLTGIGTSGIARAIISVAGDGCAPVSLAQLARTVERSCAGWTTGGLPGFARDCAAAVLVGAVLLEALGEAVALRGFMTREAIRRPVTLATRG
jgi:hypothetical protein